MLIILIVYPHYSSFSECCVTGKWLGSRQIRTNWAAKGAGINDDKQDSKSVVELTNGTSGELIHVLYPSCKILVSTFWDAGVVLCLSVIRLITSYNRLAHFSLK